MAQPLHDRLAPHYSSFRVSDRILLTGHSHQAWPDCGLQAQNQAWLDAAELVDDKWERAWLKAEEVRDGFRRILDDDSGHYALGTNTHELLARFLSALPLATRPRLVTTDGEFHSARRQLDRLREEGVSVVKVSASDAEQIAEKLIREVTDQTAAVIVSAVLFQNSHIVPHLEKVQEACDKFGALLLVDAYHAINVVPFSLATLGLERAYVVGGGYKYCELGEGNCFLRIPSDCQLRPVITGWFSEFSVLDKAAAAEVLYGQGADRFAGSTYDTTSHYRASAVFKFFQEQGLTPELLRANSQRQLAILSQTFDAADLPRELITRDQATPLEAIGGFLSLQSSQADAISKALRSHEVWTDARGEHLRFGPAPYVSDDQLRAAMHALSCVVGTLSGS